LRAGVLVFRAELFAAEPLGFALLELFAFVLVLPVLRPLALLALVGPRALLAVVFLTALAFGAAVLRFGSFLRFVEANSSSCFLLMDSTMLLEAPRRDDFGFSPRLADSAAPAAICCFLDFAGIHG
jgi:hypothetical protein